MRRVNNKNNSTLSSALILLLLAPACLADLMCYVCDNCDKVTKETPLLACNADFFNHGGKTEASTVTTTAATTTTMSAASTTEEPMGSTIVFTDNTPMPNTNEMSTTGESMSTILMESTTGSSIESMETTDASMTTPPSASLMDIFRSDIEVSTPAPGGQLGARKRRAAIDSSVSYHCFSVQKSLNNTLVTNRGCSRVEGQQSVCQELQVQYNDTHLGKCAPCTMNACNSATSSLRSPLLATLFFTLVAVALQRK